MAEASRVPNSVTFHYIKSQQFRVVHSDGIIGSVTPRGLIHYVVYSERQAIPQSMTHTLDDGNKVGDVVQSIGKGGIVREMEVDVIMDPQTAKMFHKWLGDRLAALDANKPATSEKGN